MARTVEYFYNLIASELNALSFLSGVVNLPDDYQTYKADISSDSSVSPFRHLIHGCAYCAFNLDTLFDFFKRDVETVAATAIPQTTRWMQQQTLKFQYGDPLVWDGNQYTYTTINPNNQVVSQCAVIGSGGQVLIKVAKDQGGALAPLATTEKDALASYWGLMAAPGTDLVIISDVADKLAIDVDIVYDALVLNSNGTLRSDGVTKPAEEAIASYAKGLAFNGRFWIDKFIDSIQLAEGVTSVQLNLARAKYGALAYSPIDVFYDSFAGHMQLDVTNSTITYMTA